MTGSPRGWLTASVAAVYLSAFIPLSMMTGSGAYTIAPLPALAVGWLWGSRAGIFAGIFVIPVNTLLLYLTGQPNGNLLLHPWNVAGAAGSVLLGMVAGHMHSLRQQAEQELVAREVAEEELCKSEHRYQTLVETAPDVVYQLGLDGEVLSLNPAFERITGWSVNEMIGRRFTSIVHPDDVPAADDAFRQVVEHGRTATPLELRIRSRTGEYLSGEFSSAPIREQGMIVGAFGMARDITERKQAESRLRHISYHDPLTELPNRELFLDRLNQAVLHARRFRQMLAVLFLDLDRFKPINDTLGHGVGNLLLKAVAVRISQCVREGDTVARQGSDEFLILFPGINREQDAMLVAKKVNSALAEGFSLLGHELVLTASIGISLFPSDGTDGETLLKNADAAAYQAKALGGDSYRFYAPTTNAQAVRKLLLENTFRKALEREEFLLYYQPQVDLVSGRITGAEALVRWRHPSLGLLPPMEFIPMAEETGLIVPLGEWILRKACGQGKEWRESRSVPFRMAVNLSMRQFLNNDIAEMVGRTLDTSGLDPGSLDLELTESILMRDADRTIETLRDLKSLGVHITIDDFGTGYSSLSYLKNLPLSTLKLDLAFVSTLTNSRRDEAISKAIISLAHTLDLKVIAEGVETADQRDFLRTLGCDEMQGFLFSKPLPAEEISGIMKECGPY